MYIIKAGSIFEVVDGSEREFLSPFAQEYLDQENANWERDAWKFRERADDSMLPRAMPDVILVPFRLDVATFAFLNVFSMLFTNKPLKTAGGPPAPDEDMSHRMLHHRLVNIDAIQKQERRKVAVSRDCNLIRVKQGETSVLGSNVLWFALDEVGTCHYMDGYAIYDASGTKCHECGTLVTLLGAA